MERKIGEIFKYNSEWYQCLKSHGDICDGCAGYWSDYVCNSLGNCEGKIFKKLEKVGEPFIIYGEKYQVYITHVHPYILNEPNSMPVDDSIVVVEIKQTKEDMEDLDKIKVRDYTKVEDLMLLEEKKLNLKPFDIQKAREGKPVCTRDGRKARIICFDAKGDKPIIALIEYEIDERPCNYFANGRFYSNPNENNDADLMMLPEKRSGWAKVRKDINLYDTKEEADRKMIGNDEYVTAKVFWEE